MDNTKRFKSLIVNGVFYFALTIAFLISSVIWHNFYLYKFAITCLGLASITTLMALLFTKEDVERPLYIKILAFLFMLPLIAFILFFVILYDIFYGERGGDYYNGQ